MIRGHFIIMSFRMQPLFHSSILVYLVCLSIAQPPDFDLHSCETESGNYTVNGTYHINLNKLLSSLSRNTNEYGFYNATEGQNSDRVEAMVLCRGDLDLETCRSCIDNSTTRLTQLCPNNKEAIGWYSGCFLWYTNKSIVGDIVSTNPAFHMWNINNVSGVDQFKQQLINLLDRLRIQAVAGDKRKVAAGHTTWPDFGYMFALTQCTPVLSQQECSDCLMAIINQFGQYCRGKQGCRALQPSCNARFETYPFFKDIPPSTTPGKDDNTTRTVIIIAITTVTFLVVINVSICIFMRKKKQRKHVQSVEKHAKRRHRMKENVWGNDAVYEESLELPILDYDNIVVATNNFSRTDKLGEGGFGPVYKGKLQDGQEVAVKRLSSHSGQGAEEFKNEVILISKLQHRNLVKLLGCCVDGEEKLLVYEYMVNRSLDRILFDPKKRVQLDWDRRFNIIQGIARGLLYLHRDSCLRVIHRDLKASNILLDADMNPKISDFGLARTFQVTQEMANTHKVMGTFGYMSPEYAMRGLFSEKSDVFSFGVLLLEIISGTRNTSSHFGEEYVHLLGYAWKLWNERRALELVDKELAKSCPESKVMRCIHIGLLCVQDLSMERPSMSTVVFMLSNETDIPQPKQPVYESQSLFDAYPRSLCNNICSINDVSISNIEGR